MVLLGPAEGPEPDVQVEQPGVVIVALLGEAGVPQTEPPSDVLDDSDGPVKVRILKVLKLQDGSVNNQIHCVLTSQRLKGTDGVTC